ncbi:hypothetical protein [uncultured Desulfobacter sp.]|uniref:hypothetical protein n=1 Tax=uncultured Desulfobacter sp. TaxID=240139 RepID=UPI002AAAC60E|nr:hypothetical protein [uncultured Desulfobacter sp.]
MSTVMPQGDALKKAIAWVSEKRLAQPDVHVKKLADEACLQFDLSPKDSEFLLRFVKENPDTPS